MRSTGSGSATYYSPLANNLQGTHKALHKSNSNFLHNFITPKVVSEPDPETGLFNPFPAFPYTGPLRPVYPLSERRTVPTSIPYPDYALDGIPHSERTPSRRNKIQILDKKGQEGMRKVCRLAREVLDLAAAAVRPGVTTDYIDEIVHKVWIATADILSHILHLSTTSTSPNPFAHHQTKSFATVFQISESC
jgi:hypothetical protein